MRAHTATQIYFREQKEACLVSFIGPTLSNIFTSLHMVSVPTAEGNNYNTS